MLGGGRATRQQNQPEHLSEDQIEEPQRHVGIMSDQRSLLVSGPDRLLAPHKAQALDRSQPVLPMMPGVPQRRTHNYLRHGVTSLFAAFNIADGTVIGQLHRRHRAIEFRKFLTTVDKAVRADLDVHLICDNYATHNTAEIKTWLGRHPRFHIHFTPTGSSWINQVERWFGFLTDQLLRRGVHKSVAALENDVRDWITAWNDDPKPFRWTKTADEILDSLAKYMSRISGATY